MKIFGLIIFIIGLILLTYYTDWKIYLAVYFIIWGNNIENYYRFHEK